MVDHESRERDARSSSGATFPSSPVDAYVVALEAVDRTHAAAVGSKAAHLGELSRLDGIRVPAGRCVTARAFRRMMELGSIRDRVEHLQDLPLERDEVRRLSAEIRRGIEEADVAEELERPISAAVRGLGERGGWAVRSSATAEDLPTASFAGQHDTYLNVVGVSSILEHVRRCWASLFSDAAVAYRVRNGIDHRTVEMAVVVQEMVTPRASGVLFTADPATGNRKVASIEATFGLGEALVSGTVNVDSYKVGEGAIIDRTVATKQVAIHATPGGGTRAEPVEAALQAEPALTDQQVLELAGLGRRFEAHFGAPQDVEWCLDDDGFQVVQSRPITTLFPIPEVDDDSYHVYVSVGHQQMMTDPMTPLGLSVWQLTSRAPMRVAGGRLFVDVTAQLSSPTTRDGLLEAFGRHDPLIRDALESVLEGGDFGADDPGDGPAESPRAGAPPEPIEGDVELVDELIERHRESLDRLQREIRTRSGSELLDFILADIEALRGLLFDPQTHKALMAGMEAVPWLNDRLWEWLGEENAADTLSLAAPNNITSEMGLALLDAADVIRPHPEVVSFLRTVEDDGFLDELVRVDGGAQAREAIVSYLDTYGMRCIGEIDIARPRWRERPSVLVPTILSNVDNFAPGERARRIQRGQQRARRKEQELLRRLRAQPGGVERAEQTQRMIHRLRSFIGFREYPKYGMVSRYFVYKQALVAEAGRLVEEGVLGAVDDIFLLRFDELHDVVRSRRADQDLVARRRLELRRFRTLTPPRVLTSDGEALDGAYRRGDVPDGALVGLAVSGGTVEGRARVVHDMAAADLAPGDILVTAHTDPSWSPLFVTIAGLVTEAGGLMTHGAVVAREYGLAAVVGVEHATQLIRDGQRIRVDGTRGFVEII